MSYSPTHAEIDDLFDNEDPALVWSKLTSLVRRISPDFDFSLLHSVYDDILRLFRGEYPGYGPIGTLYHDLPHTLEVLLCGARLLHGAHVSGDRISDEEITLVALAILMHDLGYAQRAGEETGTGAQYTEIHVQRGVAFMREYFGERQWPAHVIETVAAMILGTEHSRPFGRIEFGSERTRMLARIVATADITGQMADRIYLEKLLFLYLEFKEAHFGGYRSMHHLLCQTTQFYEMTRKRLDEALGGVYRKLEFHFKDTLGVSKNFYLEAIEKNMAYLTKIITCDETELSIMLKRNGIAARTKLLA